MATNNDNSNTERNRQRIGNILLRLIQEDGRRIFFEEILFAVGGFTAALFWILIIDHFFPLSSLFRSLTLLAALLFGLNSIYRILRYPYLTPPPADYAARIEKFNPEFREALVSATFFKDWGEPEGLGVSSEFVDSVIIESGELLAKKSLTGVIDYSGARRKFFFLLFGVLCLLSFNRVLPGRIPDFFARLEQPWKEFIDATNRIVKVIPGNIKIEEGTPLQISVVLFSPLQQATVVLVLEPITGLDRENRPLFGTPLEIPMQKGKGGDYHHTLLAVTQNYRYFFKIGRKPSDKYFIDVEKKVRIQEFTLAYHYPDYTGLPSFTPAKGTFDIEGVEGTKVSITARLNKRVENFKLLLYESATATATAIMESEFLGDSANNYLNELTLGKDFLTQKYYKFLIIEKNGRKTSQETFHRVQALPDQPPVIEMTAPEAEISLPSTRKVDFRGTVEDDFGIFEVILKYRINARPEWEVVNLKPDRFDGAKNFSIEFPFLLDTLPLQPGDMVTGVVVASDNKKPTANTAKSQEFKINMPSVSDMLDKQHAQQKENIENYEKFIEKEKKNIQETDKIIEELRGNKEVKWEEAEELKKLLGEQETLKKEASEIIKSFEKIRDTVKTEDLFSLKTVDKISQIQELLNKVMDKDLSERITALREAMKNVTISKEDLEKFQKEFSQEDYLKSLDRAIEQLKRVESEKSLMGLEKKIQELADRQDKINTQTREQEQKLAELAKKLNELQEQKNASGSAPIESKSIPNPIVSETAKGGDSQDPKSNESLASGSQSLDQKLRQEMERAAKDLKESLEKLAKEKEGIDQKLSELHQQEQKTGQDFEKLMEELSKTAERLASDPALLQQVEKLRQQFKPEEIKKHFEEALDALKNKNPGGAQKPEDKLLKIMLELEGKITETVDMAQNAEGQKLLMDIMGMVQLGVKISLKQETINVALENYPEKFMRGTLPAIEGELELFSEEEDVISLNIRDLGKQYEELTKKIPQLPVQLLGLVGRSEKIVIEARKDLEDRAIKLGKTKGRNAVALINEFVMALIKMQQQQQNQQGGGSGNPMDKLRNLTRRQQNLNRQSQEMRRQMANQKILDESTAEHIKRMAMEQESIAREIEQMGQRLKESQGAMSRFNELAQKMREIKQELEKVNNDERLKTKQDKLLNHLLDSERSLKQKDEEEEKERKAETAKNTPPPLVKKIPLPEHLKNQDFLGHGAGGQGEYVAPLYKNDIEEYYRNLSVFTQEEKR